MMTMRSIGFVAVLFSMGCSPDSGNVADEHWQPGVGKFAAGRSHNCVVFESGAVRCWGDNEYGQLGYGHTENIGDDEHPVSAGNVDIGGTAIAVVAGWGHSCALLDNGAVRCWGYASYTGYGIGPGFIGDDETPASMGDVDVGGTVTFIAAEYNRTCVILEGGAVRCWGSAGDGVCDLGGPLGYENLEDVGDDETPASMGDIELGGIAVSLAVGTTHTCALLDNGAVRCWGCADGVADEAPGRLGYGNSEDIGDDETPASAGDVDVGGTVVALAAGWSQTCALLDNGAVRCWGSGSGARALGYGNEESIGDDETPASAGDIDIGGKVIAIDANGSVCALLESGAVRCWGSRAYGRLGYGNEENIGDDETPADAGDIDTGGIVIQLAVGGTHNCAMLEGGALRCWGRGMSGALGYANEDDIGDNETPASVGFVQY
jgi:alpha-tubulin suppressor-like RCC1 family protein